MFSDIQKVLADQGLDHSIIRDVCLLLQYKSHRVQQAFLLKTCGLSLTEIARRMDADAHEIDHLLGDEIADINNYLNASVEHFQFFTPYR
jgi:hypothetical protein